ncbi:HAMP domain-containing sensor histidine kinase [Tsukamurella sp. 8F]|uniref:sensor histidine kinase n=1 Tax=unclassified Tsukamurella TaxID=2633480 RepID=UPI0023B9F015|nr:MULTISPECIES: HAMP domain-containing sensor histidine kinase [unclassified Tsukamurella]MDF0529521.1 HAMP domain-containing sensor histidine kinase [Tsukamurella sp. 8J]MDF0585791.1 HAMP domain-containing sensor histidine kinase [Tsukamurella sp. 8F]
MGSRRTRVRWGVRLKSTVVATVIVACAMITGAAVMVGMSYSSQNRTMYRSTSARAYAVAEQITDGGLGSVRAADLTPSTGVDLVQVLDSGGDVVHSSPETARSPLVQQSVAPDSVSRFEVEGAGGDLCGAAAGAEFMGQRYTVIVAVAAGPYRRGVWVTAAILAIEFPLVIAIVALAIHAFVGRALRPVHRITGEVAVLTSTDLASRVPVPESDDEIAVLARTMNGMLERLERSHDSQVRFLGDASHELRGPLTTLVGILDLADHTDTDVTVDTVREVLLPEATRMRSVVDDLLLLAKVDERGLELRLGDVDLDDVVLAAAAAARATGGPMVRTRVVPVRVTGDATAIARCLRNLVDNAVRHARSEVVLTLEEMPGGARITVADDGAGVPEADRVRVFDRFVRLDSERAHGGGSGLGLAIATEIAVAHGGTVSVDDSDSGGAAFRLALPAPVAQAPSAIL